jgi:3-oxoacyl-[acyl-carrier protein] reductase
VPSKALQTAISLKGRVAVITGAKRGIGYTEALAFGLAGAKVVVVTHTGTAEAATVATEIEAAGGEAFAAKADTTSSADVEGLVHAVLLQYGRLDILVNNAGITDPAHISGSLMDLSEESWDRVIASHLKGTFLCIKYAARPMVEGRWGRIINTSSIHGEVGGRPGLGHYGAAKAGVIALTRTAARELGPFGITVNAIVPGPIATDQFLTNAPTQVVASYMRQNPTGRLGKPEEVANLVLFLASEGVSYINGAAVECTGGTLHYFLGPAPTNTDRSEE